MLLNPVFFWLIMIAGDAVLAVTINKFIKGFDLIFFAPYMAGAIYGAHFGGGLEGLYSVLAGLGLIFLLVEHISLDKDFVYVFPAPFMSFVLGLIFGINQWAFVGGLAFYVIVVGGKRFVDALYAKRGSMADAVVHMFVNGLFSFALFFFVVPLLLK